MQRAVERTTCQHSTDRPLDVNWTSAGKMVLRESYPRHWSYRQRRATGSLSITGHGCASPRADTQPARNSFSTTG